MIVEGSTPAKKVNKLLNIRPNPFEDRVRLFRRAFLDFLLDGNAFFYYDGNDIYLLPANDVEVVPDEKAFISHYNYMISNQQSQDFYGFGVGKQTRKDQAIQFGTTEVIQVMAENDQSIFSPRTLSDEFGGLKKAEAIDLFFKKLNHMLKSLKVHY